MNILRSAILCRRAVAVFTLLAMLVAPLCTPMCGSRACANLSSAQNEDCHSSFAANDGARRTGVAAIRICGSQEFPAAALNERSNSPERMKHDSAVYTSSNFAHWKLNRLQCCEIRRRVHGRISQHCSLFSFQC